MDSNQDILGEFLEKVRDEIKRVKLVIWILKVAAVIGGGFLTFQQVGNVSASDPSSILGLAAAVVVTLVAVVMLSYQPDVGSHLLSAEKANSELLSAQRHQQENRRYKDEIDRASNLTTALVAALEYLEQCAVYQRKESDVVGGLMQTVKRNLVMSMEFVIQHEWSITVYKASMSTAEEAAEMDGTATEHNPLAHFIEGRLYEFLKPVETVRSRDCDVNDARKWLPGRGVAGQCMAIREAVIVADSRDSSVANLCDLPGKIARGADENHISLAAIPVLVGPDAKERLWGVVVGTTNRAKYYSNTPMGRLRAEPLRALAAALEVAVSICNDTKEATDGADSASKGNDSH